MRPPANNRRDATKKKGLAKDKDSLIKINEKEYKRFNIKTKTISALLLS